MEIATISATLGALKTSIDLIKSAVAAHDESKISGALKDINDRIFQVQNASLQAQEKMSSMRDEIETLKDGKRQLSARVAELEHQKSDREKYDLHELSEGVFVLAKIEASQNGRSSHYLCQPCMDNVAKKGVLQRESRPFTYILSCPICKYEYPTGEVVDVRF
ncbi:hypothetical protein [Paraburkholderia terrae]